MPPIHELHERLKRRPSRASDRSDVNKPPTQEFERPAGLESPDYGPSRGSRMLPKVDDTQPIPIYSD
ncbi:MAG: hypothetical protein ACPGU1_03005 [Myxococcota bacterium]